MKRDLDLCLQILKAVEVNKSPFGINQLPVITGHNDDEISYHIAILVEGGLLKGIPSNEIGSLEYFDVNLTWQGHEFLDLAQKNNLWDEAKEKIIETGIAFTFDVLFQWLKMKAQEKIRIL